MGLAHMPSLPDLVPACAAQGSKGSIADLRWKFTPATTARLVFSVGYPRGILNTCLVFARWYAYRNTTTRFQGDTGLVMVSVVGELKLSVRSRYRPTVGT